MSAFNSQEKNYNSTVCLLSIAGKKYIIVPYDCFQQPGKIVCLIVSAYIINLPNSPIMLSYRNT